jgi:hypothetical protein
MVDENTLELLNSQIRRLEKNCGWMKCGMLLLLAVCALVLVAGAALEDKPENVVAQSFSLVDAEGTLLALLAPDPVTGAAHLRFYDPDKKGVERMVLGPQRISFFRDVKGVSKDQVTLGLEDDRGVLRLRDSDGASRVVLAVGDDGLPMIAMCDAKERTRIGFTMDEDGTPMLGLVDKDGKTRASIKLRRDGSAALLLSQLNEGTSLAVRGGKDQPAGIYITDRSGRDRLILQTDVQGNPTIKMTDKDGKTVFQEPKASSPAQK